MYWKLNGKLDIFNQKPHSRGGGGEQPIGDIWKLYSETEQLAPKTLMMGGGGREQLQWGSENPTRLDFKSSKEVGLQMVWISNGIWNLKAQPFLIH